MYNRLNDSEILTNLARVIGFLDGIISANQGFESLAEGHRKNMSNVYNTEFFRIYKRESSDVGGTL